MRIFVGIGVSRTLPAQPRDGLNPSVRPGILDAVQGTGKPTFVIRIETTFGRILCASHEPLYGRNLLPCEFVATYLGPETEATGEFTQGRYVATNASTTPQHSLP